MLLHQFFIQDGSRSPVGQYKPNTGIEIYEVVRIMRGIPLFLEGHLHRFRHSAWMLHLEIPLTDADICSWLKELIHDNGADTGNIRFSYCFRPCGRFMAYFIPHVYPSPEMMERGVVCGLLHAERHDPNVKAVQSGLRAAADQLITQGGFYEVLLVSGNGRITEGSRSNVFFLVGNQLVTAPASDILPGITRLKVIGLAENSGMNVRYESLPAEVLSVADAVFLTGTSPKVLPVSRVGEFSYDPGHPILRQLIRAYDEEIDLYLARRDSVTA